MSASAYEPDKPWARQPWDTDLGFALFQDYLAQAQPRTVKPAGGLSWAQVEAMARDCYWWARAALWDDHLAEIREQTIERVTEQTAEEVARRQLALTRDLQELASLEIGALRKVAKTANGFPGAIQPRDAIRAALVGIRLERLIMGEATDRTEVGPDLSNLDADDLRRLREIQAKAGVR